MKTERLDSGVALDYTPNADVAAGDVIMIGSIPHYADLDIPSGRLGSITPDGRRKAEKDTSTFSAGDAVYWDTNGSSVGGVALSGAMTSTASGNYLAGYATDDAATDDDYVDFRASAAKRTTAIGGSVTADDITGSDSALAIAGVASTTGGSVTVAGGASSTGGVAGGLVSMTGGTGGAAGAGGAASVVGGVPASGNAAGGTGTFSGGAGSGTGAGGAVTSRGGASGGGATGNGGAWSGGGGAALSVAGNGGAATLTGGVSTTTGTGGAVTITSGASAGASGMAGAVAIDCGAAAGGTAGAMTIAGTNAASLTLGKMPRIPTATVAAAGTIQGDAAAITEGFTLVTGSTNAGVKLPSAVAGMQVIIKNNVGGNMKVWPNSSDAINAITADAAFTMAALTSCLFVAYDATTWYTIPLVAN